PRDRGVLAHVHGRVRRVRRAGAHGAPAAGLTRGPSRGALQLGGPSGAGGPPADGRIRAMAKLYFRYGAMNSGKSTALLQAAHNYEEREHQIVLAKPGIDSKAGRKILSRLGVDRSVDFVIGADDDVRADFAAHRARRRELTGQDVSCLLIDEAQFLTP